MIQKIQRVSGFLKKYLPLFVFIDIVLALSTGLLFPSFVSTLSPLIPYGMFIMLFPMMMGIVIEELKLVAKDKKIILVSIIINFILSPLIAYFWAKLFFIGFDPKFIAGWILKLTVPCSAMMVAWTGLSKGKTETALVIQVASFLIAIFAIPLWMILLVGEYVPVDFLVIAKKILWIIVLPLIAGVGARELIIHRKYGKEVFKNDIKPFLPPISSIGMYFVIFIAISREATAIITNFHLVWILILSIFVVYPVLFGLSIIISKKSGISYENAIAIGFATTAKNHGITLALAITAFGGLSVLPPSIVPMFQVLLMMFIWKISPKIRSHYCKKDF